MAASLAEDKPLIEEHQPTLFQTAAWEKAWLATWGQHLARDSGVHFNHQSNSYYSRQHLKGCLPIKTATTLGCPERGTPSIRREYYRASRHQIEAQLKDVADQRKFNDVILGSPTYHTIKATAHEQGLMVLEQDPGTAYSVNTGSGDYQAYLNQLSSNTRLKLHNRRKRLSQAGIVTQTDLWPDVNTFIEHLNHFHQQRWGKPCYQGLNLAFIQQFLPLLSDEGYSIGLNCMAVDGKAVSLLLDIEVNQRIYNLQSGFAEQYRAGLSLGTLHFGYRIEQAFKQPHLRAYDFMAGDGKHSNYKAALATQHCQLVTLTVVRPRWLQLLYCLWRPGQGS